MVGSMASATSLRNTERKHGRIEQQELVNSVATYHSHAEVVQGTANVRYGSEEDLPLGLKRAFFWRRVIDVSSNREVPADHLQKLMQLPVPVPHPANTATPGPVAVTAVKRTALRREVF